jgi:cell division protein FtsB
VNSDYLELPLDLRFDFERDNKLLNLGQHREALDGYQKIYEQLVLRRPAKRYHKGGVLHNMGVASHYLGHPDEALNYLILAYIEDLLSQKIEEEDSADELPAATNLKRVYGIKTNLEQIKAKVKEIKEKNHLIHDPEEILNEVKRSQHDLVTPTKKPEIEKVKRKVGQFTSEWSKRVFIGGSYSKHFAEINQIKGICRALGFDPVIASDFENDDMIHHHALMLLHECSRAIFEVTDEVGQLMEIERIRDYGLKPLFLCQENAHHSEMVTALFKWQGHEFTKYGHPDELDKIVKEFLSRPLS